MITLTQGLADLSKELGESVTNTDQRRIQHYNDAIQEFGNEKKWPFLVKKNIALNTGTGKQPIDITSMEDMRMPGGIKEISIAGSKPILPVFFEDRFEYRNKNHFYITPDEQSIEFTKEVSPNQSMLIWHWYVPSRITSTQDEGSFPIPQRYRKAIGTLAAAFVQYSRYLDNQGSRLLNVYGRLLDKVEQNQSEKNAGTPRRIPNTMTFRGPMRQYRNGSRVR